MTLPETPDFEALRHANAARAQRLAEMDLLLHALEVRNQAMLTLIHLWKCRAGEEPPDA